MIAVLPFASRVAGPGFDGDEFGDILASEILQYAGVRVIRPAQVRAALLRDESLAGMDDALRVGRRLGADHVLACAVTDYDPYDPPRVALAVQLLSVASAPLSAADVDRMTQSASWRRGPYAMSRERAGHFVRGFEQIYDSRDAALRRKIVAYAESRAPGDSAFPREREFLAVQSKFIQFVSTQVLQRAFAEASHGS